MYRCGYEPERIFSLPRSNKQERNAETIDGSGIAVKKGANCKHRPRGVIRILAYAILQSQRKGSRSKARYGSRVPLVAPSIRRPGSARFAPGCLRG